MPSPFAHQGGNFNFEYTTASGGVASLVTTNAQRGVNAAAMLLGTGVWWIRPGANVAAGLLAEVLRGLLAERLAGDVEADGQPRAAVGSAARADRALQPHVVVGLRRRRAPSARPGAIAFPGVDGYSRNLWDTTYDNWGPRVGAAYQWNDRTVLRGGFGITYLPTNTGYFSSPVDYGVGELRGRRAAAGVRHEPGGRAGDPLLGSGADLAGDRRQS